MQSVFYNTQAMKQYERSFSSDPAYEAEAKEEQEKERIDKFLTANYIEEDVDYIFDNYVEEFFGLSEKEMSELAIFYLTERMEQYLNL